MFQYFGWKLPILGQNLTCWRVNRGHLLKLNILTPKCKSVRDSTHFEQLSVNMRYGVRSLHVPQKKK